MDNKQYYEWRKASEEFPDDWESKHWRYADDHYRLDTDLFEHRNDALCKIGGKGRVEYSEIEWLKPVSTLPIDREQIVNEIRDALLKQTFLMSHENGYPSEAVPKATILSLPALMKVKSQPIESIVSEKEITPDEIDNKLMELLNRCEVKPDIKAIRKYIISLLKSTTPHSYLNKQ